MNTEIRTGRPHTSVPKKPPTAAHGLDFLKGLLAPGSSPPPFAETADIWPTHFESGRAIFHGRPSRRFYNPMGIVHGGWLATLLDTSMACAVQTLLEAGQSYTTIELKTAFVKPVTETTGILICEGTLVHAGRRVAHAEGRIKDADGNLIAYGSESCLISSHPVAAGADGVPGKDSPRTQSAGGKNFTGHAR